MVTFRIDQKIKKETKNIGEEIRRARKNKGFTLRELAKKTGISHPYLSQLENGHNDKPSAIFLRNISDALDSPIIQMAIDNKVYEMSVYEEEIENRNEKFRVEKEEKNSNAVFNVSRIKELETKYYALEKEYEELIKAKNMYYAEEPINSPDNELQKTQQKKFDLNYLLNADITLYYKDEILTDENKRKIKIMLSTILE